MLLLRLIQFKEFKEYKKKKITHNKKRARIPIFRKSEQTINIKWFKEFLHIFNF